VHVVRTGDGDGVDVAALLVEHFAIVGVLGDFRVGRESLFGALGIRVGHGDDVLVGASGDIAVALAAGADGGDVQFFIRGFVPEMFEGRSASEPRRGDGAGEQGAVEEMPSRNAFVCHLRTILSTLQRDRGAVEAVGVQCSRPVTANSPYPALMSTMFAIPGRGAYFIDAANNRDHFLILGLPAFGAIALMFAKLLVEIAYAFKLRVENSLIPAIFAGH